MRYGLAVWGGKSAGNLNRILLLQKRTVRMMAELGSTESCRDLFSRQKVQTKIGL